MNREISISNYQASLQKADYPNTVFYQIFVQSFYDSNGDGIGDINGLKQKIPYLKELGVGAVWLMPMHPAMSYHKYDVIDYYSIHPDYGTLEDFKQLVAAFHKNNIRVILDLVVNHTGSNHPWFQQALQVPHGPYRDYYIWTRDSKLIAKNRNHWHSPEKLNKPKGNGEKYYGLFWHEMPDLNYKNTKVRDEVINVSKFWIDEIGIDGFRLDAVRFFYPEHEKNRNHAWWKRYRRSIDYLKKPYFLVGEIWGEDTIIAPFLKKGLHAGFNFDLSYAIINAVKKGEQEGVIDRLLKTRSMYEQEEPDFYDALFLANHDQNRLMSQVGACVGKAKVAASVLLTLPGTPFIYYGEELGMKGTKPDEFIREPFPWNFQNPEKGQTTWMEPKFTVADSVTDFATQKNNKASIYNHYCKLIKFRNQSNALTIGGLLSSSIQHPNLLTFYRESEHEKLLVVHNLSGSSVLLKDEYFDVNNLELVFSTITNIQVKGGKVDLDPYASYVFRVLNK